MKFNPFERPPKEQFDPIKVEEERRTRELERNEKLFGLRKSSRNFISTKAHRYDTYDERKIRRMKNKQARVRRKMRNHKRHGRQ